MVAQSILMIVLFMVIKYDLETDDFQESYVLSAAGTAPPIYWLESDRKWIGQ
jgi:hypothetical protein